MKKQRQEMRKMVLWIPREVNIPDSRQDRTFDMKSKSRAQSKEILGTGARLVLSLDLKNQPFNRLRRYVHD